MEIYALDAGRLRRYRNLEPPAKPEAAITRPVIRLGYVGAVHYVAILGGDVPPPTVASEPVQMEQPVCVRKRRCADTASVTYMMWAACIACRVPGSWAELGSATHCGRRTVITTRMLPVPPRVVMVTMTMMVRGAWKRARSKLGPWVTMQLHEMSAVVMPRKEVRLRQVLTLRLPMLPLRLPMLTLRLPMLTLRLPMLPLRLPMLLRLPACLWAPRVHERSRVMLALAWLLFASLF